MKLLMVAVLSAALVPAAPPSKFLDESAAGHIRVKTYLGEMSDSELGREALEYLAPKDVTVGELSLYGSREDQRQASPKGGTDWSYKGWLYRLKREKTACPEVAEVTKIGSAIVLRSMDRHCQARRQLLKGDHDPLILDVDGTKLEILYMTFQPLDYSRRIWGRDRMRISAYVRSDGGVSKKLARGMLDYLRKVSGAPEVLVVLRKDAWFIQNSGFPMVYPFEPPPAHIPTKQEYERDQATCGLLDPWPVQCW